VPDSFLDRTAADLLDLFAAGKNTPGSGSAAALMGALAGSLIQAVALYSKAEAILIEARERSERLRRAVDADAAAFNEFWRLRKAGTAEKEAALRRAIEVPLAIVDDCLVLAGLGRELYAHGFKNARAESSTAALAAMAGAEAALHTARLNLKAAENAAWFQEIQERVEELGAKVSRLARAYAFPA
jgi:formiminotetrahydrofolate cyclodeaminase